MIILTCSNVDIAYEKYKEDKDTIRYQNFSFRRVIEETVKKAEENGYKPVVYDLGTLGIGEKYQINDEFFAEKGYYEVKPMEGYRSRSLFKPEVVKYCLSKHRDFTVYLDGDAQLLDNIDEILTGDYDVGVTLRKPSELNEGWHQMHYEMYRYVNAGVIFFNPSAATERFVGAWEQRTHEVGNDQKALNQLTCPEEYPQPFSVHIIDGVMVKYFPCEQYNYYYFEEGWFPNIKIMHFKGLYRNFFPFDWKKRLYCRTIVPLKSLLSPVVKKVIRLFRH